VRTFKAKTTTFNNTKTISARDWIDINTRNFTNTSGRLQTYGNLTLTVDGQFRNGGGGTLRKNVPERITYWTYDGGNDPVPNTRTVYRDIYEPNLGKAGVITSGKTLKIRAKNFDNMFGVLNASRQLDIISTTEVGNEYGLIYSGDTATINGTLLKNGGS
jgi:adhesin HecA-like repeat protein